MDALITEAKNGDKEAFVRLIRMNKQSLYKTAWIYLRDEQDEYYGAAGSSAIIRFGSFSMIRYIV